MRICFLSSQMNAIGEFSAPLNGVRRGHPEKMSSRQKQKTPKFRFEWDPLPPLAGDSATARSVEQEVGGSIPPNCTKLISRFFGHLASQISRYGKRMGSQGSTVNELRAMERLCLEQAALCVLQESREALEQIALNYRTAAGAAGRQRLRRCCPN